MSAELSVDHMVALRFVVVSIAATLLMCVVAGAVCGAVCLVIATQFAVA